MTPPKMRPIGLPEQNLMQCLHCGMVMGQRLLSQVAHENHCDGENPTLAIIDPQDLAEVERLRGLLGIDVYTDHLSNALAAFAREWEVGCPCGWGDREHDPREHQPTPHPCGHWPVVSGCGGCDPSAIDYEFGGDA